MKSSLTKSAPPPAAQGSDGCAPAKATVERRAGLTVRGWSILGAVVVIVLLEAAPRLGLVDTFALVPLSAMVLRALALLIDPVFLETDLVPSLLSIGVSFVLAVGVGILMGVLIWAFPWMRKIFDPWLATYYAIPTFALYPLLVALMGIGVLPIVLLATLFAVVAMISATVDGLDAIPRSIIRLTAVLRLTRSQRMFKVLLPAALPQISVGLRLALSYSLIMVLASEFVLSTRGLGHFISNAYNDFAITDMYAGVLLVFTLALGLNSAFAAALRRRSRRVLP